MKNSLMIGIVAVLAACSPAHAGEFNDKPVMCGNDEEMFGTISFKDEIKMWEATQLTSVRDPDEPNGIRDMPAMLPVAIYMNLENKTYSLVEYHPGYEQYCILSFGVDLKAADR